MASSVQQHFSHCRSLPEPLSDHLFMDDPALTVLRAGWIVRSLLVKHAVQGRVRGVNVLIYGPPGTGKTELVKTLAAGLGLTLFEVSTEDSEGDPVSGQRRLDAYRLAQQLRRRRPGSLVLFDEIEDVFEGLERVRHPLFSQKALNKGWINQLLEANPVPSVWISNQVGHIDQAFLRRFDFVLHLKPRRGRCGSGCCASISVSWRCPRRGSNAWPIWSSWPRPTSSARRASLSQT